MIRNDEMIEYRIYETKLGGIDDIWFYGIRKFELDKDKNYVVVIDLVGAEKIINYFGKKNCILVYLDVSEKVREIRARNRGSFDEIEWNRRLLADYKDFSFINLQAFENRYKKIWEISNELHGDKALGEIATVVDFIAQGRLY